MTGPGKGRRSKVGRGKVQSTLKPPPLREWFCNYLPIVRLDKPDQVKEYVDGKDYCADLYTDLGKATSEVFLTGLHYMADFGITRGSGQKTLVDTLAAVAGRKVKIYLIVSQFWEKERHMVGDSFYWLNEIHGAITAGIMKKGGLAPYFPETFKLFKALAKYPGVSCRTDIHNGHHMHSNHQKTVVIDNKIAYLGGIDLTHVDGDRWDTSLHAPGNRHTDRHEKYWHDIHCRLEGPAVQFVVDNFHARWNHGSLYRIKTDTYRKTTLRKILTPMDPQAPPEVIEHTYPVVDTEKEGAGRHKFPAVASPSNEYPKKYSYIPDPPHVQIVRSMPQANFTKGKQKPAWNKAGEGTSDFQGRSLEKDWERSCKDAYLLGIRAARKSIYLENQWISDEDIWEELEKAAKRNKKKPGFRIVIMLPHEFLAAAGFGANQDISITKSVRKVIEAGRDFRAFGMYSLLQKAQGPVKQAQIYVHSKIMIIDDCWSLIGSANAGGISLEGMRPGMIFGGGSRPDTELSIIVLSEAFAKRLRKSIWGEHLIYAKLTGEFTADADEFRRQARAAKQRLRFSSVYSSQFDKQGNYKGTWRLSSMVDPELVKNCEAQGRIVTVPSGTKTDALDGKTVYKCEIPALPPLYRAWCRWICLDADHKSWKVRSADNQEVVFWYSDQFSAYIPKLSAAKLSGKKGQRGEIRCRVQITPSHQKAQDRSTANSFVFKYPVTLG